ncbi:MAG: hypothetical protein M1434_07920 [Chloroflexi bacterium]|nr:hypothetical protein [Chloroflexota bacterium]MCL5274656.1 hypothetical protein [Chloroflexota bacterium]
MVITDLPDLIAALPEQRRARFERIFNVDLARGECRIPPTMREWTVARFGSIDDVEHQRIVRVTNTVTWEGAIFNPLRTRRPMLSRPAVAMPDGEDVFADPLRSTAVDVYGRVSGEYCVTTSNIARWDSQCSVLVFNEPDPFAFRREHLRDYFRTALRWADAAHAVDPQAVHLVWMWNGGTAGGASIPHAHAQLGLGRQTPYAMVEGLRRAAMQYRAATGANYFDDLCAAHDDVGLGYHPNGLCGFVNLAAARPRDTWIISPAFDDALADALNDALRALIERAGVRGFDVGVIMPPLFQHNQTPSEKPGVFNDQNWDGFPVIARIVDRGRPDALSSDVGAMDLFGQRVIADDPYITRAALGG